MTRAPGAARDGRAAGALASLGVAAGLAAMLFASRLPPGPEFILPRRGGYGLYLAAWSLLGTALGRAFFSFAVAFGLAFCACGWAWSLSRAARAWPRAWSGRLGLCVGPLFAAILAERLCARVLDVVQLVWFPYGGMDARELPTAFAAFAAALVAAAAAAHAWAGGRRRRATFVLAALVATDLACGAWNASHGVGRALGAPAPYGKTLFVVLTDGPKGPDREVYALPPDVFADADARPALRALAARPRDARALPALRALYELETMRGDLPALREALLLGASRGDALAPSLLLAHLTAAAPSAEARAALGAVADEDAWRVGPRGAAAIARAYARLGDRTAAERWAGKAAGPGGVAPGLLGLDVAVERPTGRVAGTLRAPGRTRVALYSKSDPSAPYLLDASVLSASAEPDARGRFVFEGLPVGRYYLAVAVSAGDGRRGEVSVLGSRGDIVVDARRPSLDLPPLTLKFTPR